jgi:hypothetical protein
MKTNSLKGFAVWLLIILGSAQMLWAQGPRGGGFGPQRDHFMPPPPPPPPLMKACGDYVFVLQGATLYRYNPSNSQQAGSISLVDTQAPQRPHKQIGLLIPAGGNGKPESLLVLLGNRLFVINPSGFTKPTPIVLPEPQGSEKPDSKAPTSVGTGSGKQAPPPPTPQEGMGDQPDGPGFGEQAPPPPPPMGLGEPGGHAFRPGAGQMPAPPLGPPMPQVEVKGSKLFLIQGRRLLVIDYQNGDVKTVALPEQPKAEK